MTRVPKMGNAEQLGDRSWPLRITIRETADGMGIYNPSRRNMPLVLFLLLWLGGWSVGEYFAITELLRGDSGGADMFLLIWVTFWTFGGAVCWWLVLWNLFGSERLFVTGGAVVRSVGLGPLRWRSVSPASSVRNLRLISGDTDITNSATVSAIAFDVDGRTRRFGVGLDKREMEAALAALRRVLPHASAQDANAVPAGTD